MQMPVRVCKAIVFCTAEELKIQDCRKSKLRMIKKIGRIIKKIGTDFA